MKKHIFSTFVAVFFFSLGASKVFACSCLPPKPVEEEYKTSSAVFSGKVIGVTKSGYSRNVKIRVEKSWKGEVAKTVTITTPIEDGTCGYNFAIGKKYLIYTYGGNKKNLSTNHCTRTKTLSDAAEDIKALNKIKSA